MNNKSSAATERRGSGCHGWLSGSLLVAVLVTGAEARAEGGRGQALYGAACASCHGAEGRGGPPYRVGFATRLPDFTDCGFATREPDSDWRAVVHKGGPARGFDPRMPAFGEALGEAEVEQTLHHLRGFCPSRAWPRGELNLPRPLVTEKAFPEDEAVLTATVATQSQGAVTGTLIYEQRILARGQIEVRLPMAVRELESGSWRAGIGDIGLGTKWALVHSLRSGSILSLGTEVVLPTGEKDRGFGKGVVRIEPFLAAGQRLPAGGFLQVQVGAELSTRPGSVAHEIFWRAALGTSFAYARFYRSFSPMVEVLGARELEEGQPTLWDLVPQVQVTLSRRKHIMASLGVQLPLESTERKPVVLFYLLWDWFDGGFFEGW